MPKPFTFAISFADVDEMNDVSVLEYFPYSKETCQERFGLKALSYENLNVGAPIAIVDSIPPNKSALITFFCENKELLAKMRSNKAIKLLLKMIIGLNVDIRKF